MAYAQLPMPYAQTPMTYAQALMAPRQPPVAYFQPPITAPPQLPHDPDYCRVAPSDGFMHRKFTARSFRKALYDIVNNWMGDTASDPETMQRDMKTLKLYNDPEKQSTLHDYEKNRAHTLIKHLHDQLEEAAAAAIETRRVTLTPPRFEVQAMAEDEDRVDRFWKEATWYVVQEVTKSQMAEEKWNRGLYRNFLLRAADQMLASLSQGMMHLPIMDHAPYFNKSACAALEFCAYMSSIDMFFWGSDGLDHNRELETCGIFDMIIEQQRHEEHGARPRFDAAVLPADRRRRVPTGVVPELVVDQVPPDVKPQRLYEAPSSVVGRPLKAAMDTVEEGDEEDWSYGGYPVSFYSMPVRYVRVA